MTSNHARLIALLSAILAAAALRLVPHPPNFTPIGAMALFSGAYLGRRGAGFRRAARRAAAERPVLGFYPGMLRSSIERGADRADRLARAAGASSLLRVGAAAVASAVLFFVVTNFGMWAVQRHLPARPSRGLAACYVAAIPSSRTRSPATCSTAALLFGGFALLERAVPALRAQREPRPA